MNAITYGRQPINRRMDLREIREGHDINKKAFIHKFGILIQISIR